jgi:hypothetical protein
MASIRSANPPVVTPRDRVEIAMIYITVALFVIAMTLTFVALG